MSGNITFFRSNSEEDEEEGSIFVFQQFLSWLEYFEQDDIIKLYLVKEIFQKNPGKCKSYMSKFSFNKVRWSIHVKAQKKEGYIEETAGIEFKLILKFSWKFNLKNFSLDFQSIWYLFGSKLFSSSDF